MGLALIENWLQAALKIAAQSQHFENILRRIQQYSNITYRNVLRSLFLLREGMSAMGKSEGPNL